MKLGVCVGLTGKTEKKIIDPDVLSGLMRIGYDYVELPISDVAALSKEQFRELLSCVQKESCKVESCNVFFPGTLRLTGDHADQDTAMEHVKVACNRAAQLDARVIVLGSSGAKNLPEGFPYEKGVEQFKTLLHRIQGVVAPLNITVVVEPLNTKESNFITSVKEGEDIVRAVSESNILLLADFYHMAKEKEDFSILSEIGDILHHVHIASGENRRYPKQSDPDNYAAFAGFLKEGKYTGCISIEGSSDDILTDAAESFHLLKSIFF